MTYKIIKNKIKKVFGVGYSRISKIYKKIGVNTLYNINKIKYKQNIKLKKSIKFFTYNNTLKSKSKKMLEFYIKLKNYKGTRHAFNRPARGQRTHTNAKTVGRHRKILLLDKKIIKYDKKKNKKTLFRQNRKIKFNYLFPIINIKNPLIEKVVYFKKFRFNFLKKCIRSIFLGKVKNAIALKKKFLKKIQIKISQNNIFFTFVDLTNKKTLQTGSSGVYKVKISKRKLKYFYKNLIFIFFKKLKCYCNNLNNTIFKIIAPIRLRKKISKIVKKKIKVFNKGKKK